MKMNQDLLRNINVRRLAKYVIFETSDIKPEIETKAQKGLRDIECVVTEMLSQDMLSHIIRFDDAAESVGICAKDARHNIRKAIKVGQKHYDGTYGRPCDIEPEQAIYLVAALVIQEYGRRTDNLSEYVVRNHIGDYLDMGAIKTEYDMSCYVLLIDYFERCLEHGKVSITKFVNDHKSSLATSRRLNNFIKENSWYGDEDAVDETLGIYASQPKLSDVTNALLDEFKLIREKAEKEKEEYELNQACDNK